MNSAKDFMGCLVTARKAVFTFDDGEVLEKTYLPRCVGGTMGFPEFYTYGCSEMEDDMKNDLIKFREKYRRKSDIKSIDFEDFAPEVAK